jgi:hypothetical protein
MAGEDGACRALQNDPLVIRNRLIAHKVNAKRHRVSELQIDRDRAFLLAGADDTLDFCLSNAGPAAMVPMASRRVALGGVYLRLRAG